MNTVRTLIEQYGIHPRKRLGQSFLEDRNIIRQIVAMAALGGDDTVVEIGAGLGTMTEELAKQAGRVIALEIDERLTAVLRERFAEEGRVEVLQTDVMKYDFSSAAAKGRIKVVANVPSNISTPILFRLLDFRRSISTMILMFQKELADRIAASPGTKAYGIPSVLVAKYTQASCELAVPATCFYPVPRVSSSVLRLTVRQEIDRADGALFSQIVRGAFARRRKTLWNNLRHIGLPEESLDRVFLQSGIDRNRRAETLSVEEFSLLAAALIDSGFDPVAPLTKCLTNK
jgi:16S rRNA (adenine1518-N6/adenine1519-N6)-dimethyltransferase